MLGTSMYIDKQEKHVYTLPTHWRMRCMEEVTTLQLVEGATKLGAMSLVPSPPLSFLCLQYGKARRAQFSFFMSMM